MYTLDEQRQRDLFAGTPSFRSGQKDAAVRSRIMVCATSLVSNGCEMNFRTMVAAAAAGVVLLALFRKRGAGKSVRHREKPRVLSRNRPLISHPKEFSIVSYNVLCDRFATGRRLPHVYHGYLHWDYRWPRLKSELAGFDADVICLQEVTLNRWDEVQQFMADLGYQAVLQDKSGSEHVLALFFKASKFQLAWQEMRSRALLVQLLPVERSIADKSLWVVNLHLEGSPYRPNDRISQLKHALQRLQHHQGESAECSDVVVCGDFNSQPHDTPYLFLKSGRLDRGATEAYLPQIPVTSESIGHPYALQEVYETAKAVPPFTRKVNHEGCVMDFMWCSRHLQVAAVMRPLPFENRELVDRHYLPNKLHPSDHLPLGALIKWGEE